VTQGYSVEELTLNFSSWVYLAFGRVQATMNECNDVAVTTLWGRGDARTLGVGQAWHSAAQWDGVSRV
jgi:hypothetical protein